MKGFADPKSIAVIGASNDITKIGGMIIMNMLNAGFDGKLYPINPKGEDIQGLKSYKSVTEIDEPIDLAVIVIKSSYVIPELDNLKAAGIKYAIILTAGFKEDSPEGAELEKQLVAKAKEYGIRILGPNCFGNMDPYGKVNATFAKAMPKQGHLSIFSQSGAVGSSMLDWAVANNVGLSKFITFGNKCDVDEAELISVLDEDANTHVIGMYCEGISNGQNFVKAIGSMKNKKPIVIFKSGSTEAGGAAASSHTGSLAGSDAVNSVVFRKLNIYRAENLERLPEYFGRKRNEDVLDAVRVVVEPRYEVARCIPVEKGDRVVLQLRKNILLYAAQNLERNPGHKISAQIPRKGPHGEHHGKKKRNANDIRHGISMPVALLQKDFAQNLVENDRHAETA